MVVLLSESRQLSLPGWKESVMKCTDMLLIVDIQVVFDFKTGEQIVVGTQYILKYLQKQSVYALIMHTFPP